MDNSYKRFQKRKEILKQNALSSHLHIVADEDLVEQHLTSCFDYNFFFSTEKYLQDTYTSLHENDIIEIDQDEVKNLVKSMEKDFDKERLNLLVGECKNAVLDNIIKPFGIGHILQKYDKDGGNVTTLKNFKDGVVSSENDQKRYEEYKKGYDRSPYDQVNKLNRFGQPVVNKEGNIVKLKFNDIKKDEIYTKIEEGTIIKDGYTDKELGVKMKTSVTKFDKQIDLEHITSVKQIDKDAKNHLYAEGDNAEARLDYRVKLAQADANTTLIEGSMNSSKGSKDLKKWAAEPNSKDPSKSNQEFYGIDSKLIELEYKKSKNHLHNHQITNQIKKQGLETIKSGATEGFKMGMQQALGVVLKEFTESVFDEISDIYKNGYKGKNRVDHSFFSVLKERLLRISNNVLNKWKEVVLAFKEGFVSGLLSNLITIIINMFVRTSKRVVRIIREGIFSLFRAIKLLFNPPANMTKKEAAHEATKLIVAGLAISGGILLEQQLEIYLKAIPFADLISTVIVGIITGLSTALLVFLIDKIDLLKVIKEKRNNFVDSSLDSMIASSISEIEDILDKLEVRSIA